MQEHHSNAWLIVGTVFWFGWSESTANYWDSAHSCVDSSDILEKMQVVNSSSLNRAPWLFDLQNLGLGDSSFKSASISLFDYGHITWDF